VIYRRAEWHHKLVAGRLFSRDKPSAGQDEMTLKRTSKKTHEARKFFRRFACHLFAPSRAQGRIIILTATARGVVP